MRDLRICAVGRSLVCVIIDRSRNSLDANPALL